MPPDAPAETKPIKTLILQIFLPAVILVATLLAVFAYNWHHATIIDGFDRKLVTTSALTGAMIDPEDHDKLMAAALAEPDADALEGSPEYLRNVEPIRRILEKLRLTYLYSQAIGGEEDIVYVLDGSLGDEHSPIGSVDDLSDETMAGITKSEADGSVYVSPIEYQEQWGMLKTAAAPVYDSKGGISATAGADVNISLILVATQNALFASTLIGIGSILACLVIALFIVRRVAGPIEALKDQALTIAAGGGRSPDETKAPSEVAELSEALFRMADGIAGQALERKEAAEGQARAANIALIHQEREALPRLLLVDGNAQILWVPVTEDELERGLAEMAAQQLAERFAVTPELAKHWRALADTRAGLCLIVRSSEGTIEQVGDQAVVIVRGKQEIAIYAGTSQAFDPSTDLIRLARGPAFALSDQAGGAR